MAYRQAVGSQIQVLEAEGYHLKCQVRHSDWQVVFLEATKKKAKIMWLYYGTQLIYFIALMYLMAKDFPLQDDVALSVGIRYVLYGFIGAMGITPLHEMGHYVAMKMLGATEMDFRVRLKSFSFSARSHGFVMKKESYRYVLLLPFVAVNSLCLILLWVLPKGLNLSLASLGFLHVILSISDFGILSFLEESHKKELLTLEDLENEVTYFYEK